MILHINMKEPKHQNFSLKISITNLGTILIIHIFHLFDIFKTNFHKLPSFHYFCIFFLLFEPSFHKIQVIAINNFKSFIESIWKEGVRCNSNGEVESFYSAVGLIARGRWLLILRASPPLMCQQWCHILDGVVVFGLRCNEQARIPANWAVVLPNGT